MKQERWRRVEELLHAALEMPPEARRTFLDAACGEDHGLREQVGVLVSKDERADSLWDKPLPADVTATLRAGGSLVGRQFGTYRILSKLGAGGMGEVYRAHDAKLDRDVAIKTLSNAFACDPDLLSRFKREAGTLLPLNHPNIAAIYGMEESGEGDFLVLELVEGDTLSGPLPLATTLDRAAQVAKALEAAHEKGIFHGDLKPANVKVTPRGRVKVLDFGLAKAVWEVEGHDNLSGALTAAEVETFAAHVVGTPGYMSPEQIQRKQVDGRTDIWAFGCLLYELLAGKRAFTGDTASETITAVLEREPDWQALPAKTPAKIHDLLRQCLRKDAGRRLDNIADARRTIEQAQRERSRWRVVAVAAAAVAGFAVGGGVWLRGPASPLDHSTWTQLSKFPDSVSRVVAFTRGNSTLDSPLPDGEPVQVTHVTIAKMSPAYSPDGSRIAPTTQREREFSRDTLVVPAQGGKALLWLGSASGLVWTGPRQLLSEIRTGVHMGIVAGKQSRMGAGDVYFPANDMGMAHPSYLSPDGKWVLLVEMDRDHRWLPCRVVPIDGSSQGRRVGPPGGGCTSGAWSPDSRWVYLTSTAVETNQVWRQPFADDWPEQMTPGPTEEKGIAMAPDGRAVVAAMALQDTSLWVRDAKGERALLTNGNTAEPKFTPDGKKLCYRIVNEAPNVRTSCRTAGEVRVADLESGHSEPLVRGFQAFDYDISADGRQVVMETADIAGKPQLWLTPLDRSSPPRQVPNVVGGSPRFGPGGEIYFQRRSGRHVMEDNTASSVGVVYRVHQDGTGLKKALEQPILDLRGVSPDGRWLVARASLGRDGAPAWQAFPLGRGTRVTIGSAIFFDWAADGSSLSVTSESGSPIPEGRSYLIPLTRGLALPRIPAGGGFHTEEDIARLPGARRIDAYGVVPGPSPDVYAFYRRTAQPNLYGIPLPRLSWPAPQSSQLERHNSLE